MRFLKLACVSLIPLGCALAQPSVAPNGVLNNASYIVGQPVAPGSVVSIFGTGMAESYLTFDTIPLSATLGSTTVFVNGEPAPLYFVTNDVEGTAPNLYGQINAQLPWDLPTSGTANVTVRNGSVISAPMRVSMAAMAPGIYSIPAGVGYAVAVNPDGSIAAPVGAIPGYPTHPAKAGDALFMYASGLGAVGFDGKTSSPPAPGAASLDGTRFALTTPTLLIGGTQSQVIFAGLSPQFVGINQINFIVPSGPSGSSVPIQLREAGITSTDQVVIAIQ